MKKTAWALCLALAFTSCGEEEPKGIAIDKHGTVDIKLSQQQLDNGVMVTTRKDFYDNYGALVGSRVSFDTLPPLGYQKDTLNTGRQNDDGDDIDTVINHRKNYQFYITVKP